MTVAELTNVTKRFGAVTALDRVNLEIYGGEIVGLLGRNGAGKTTAARLLLGLAHPDSGTARVFDADPRQAKTRTRIGTMLQVANLRETLRPCELIRLFSSYYPAPMPYAEVVRTAGLEGIEKRLLGKLSGGQTQRVLFALAICGNPDLLILDEPTAGLDVESRRALWFSIRQFVRRGGSVLLTTHYLEEADALSSRIVILDRGRVLTEGTPEALKVRANENTLEDAFLSLTRSHALAEVRL